MKNRTLKKLVIVSFIAVVVFSFSCKVSDEIIQDFLVAQTSGYSMRITTVDPDDRGLTSINLFVAVKNNSESAGTITNWNFKIRHDIVTLLEINPANYTQYNLKLSQNMGVPVNKVTELFVTTPQPFDQNALPESKLSFDPYIPTEVVVEVEVTDADGNITNITGRGDYTFDEEKKNETKYNILGEWSLKRVVEGNKKDQQKLVFAGTKTSGQFIIYKANSEVFHAGNYTVTNLLEVNFKSSGGTEYWGTFKAVNKLEGTLVIPEDKKNKEDSKSGTWTATKTE